LARFTLVALVAVVAVVALPDNAPEKVVVVKVLVEGLKVSPDPRLNGWLLFVEEENNAG
jgi:hypothetical protein